MVNQEGAPCSIVVLAIRYNLILPANSIMMYDPKVLHNSTMNCECPDQTRFNWVPRTQWASMIRTGVISCGMLAAGLIMLIRGDKNDVCQTILPSLAGPIPIKEVVNAVY